MPKIEIHEMNKCVGRLRKLYVIIHVDKDGNEGILAEPAVMKNALTGEPRIGGKAELSPYDYDLPRMEAYVKQLQEVMKDTGYTIKIKEFIAVDSFN